MTETEELQAYIVTWVTHNSRVSERMVEYGVRKGKSLRLDSKSEEVITKSISSIVKNDQLRILAYNICVDHVHVVLVCLPSMLTGIVQKLKSISSKEHNVAMGITKSVMEKLSDSTTNHPSTRGHDPLPNHMSPIRPLSNHLWAQKFHRRRIHDEIYLYNAIKYVRYNRQKHKLPENPKMQAVIDAMICTEEEAFSRMVRRSTANKGSRPLARATANLKSIQK